MKENPTRRKTKYRIVQVGSDPIIGIQGKHVVMKSAGERRGKHVWNERRRIMYVSAE